LTSSPDGATIPVMNEKKRASREEKHPFVRGKFEPGTRGGQTPDETCDVCDRDPRNVVHQVDLIRAGES